MDILGGWLDMRYRLYGWPMGDPARCQQQRMQMGKDFCHYFRSTWKLRLEMASENEHLRANEHFKGPHTTQASGWCWSICIPEPWTHLGYMENVPQVSVLPPPGCHKPDISISEISCHQGIDANVRATWGFWSTLCVGLGIKSAPQERNGDQRCPWQAPDRGEWKNWDVFSWDGDPFELSLVILQA